MSTGYLDVGWACSCTAVAYGVVFVWLLVSDNVERKRAIAGHFHLHEMRKPGTCSLQSMVH